MIGRLNYTNWEYKKYLYELNSVERAEIICKLKYLYESSGVFLMLEQTAFFFFILFNNSLNTSLKIKLVDVIFSSTMRKTLCWNPVKLN